MCYESSFNGLLFKMKLVNSHGNCFQQVVKSSERFHKVTQSSNTSVRNLEGFGFLLFFPSQ